MTTTETTKTSGDERRKEGIGVIIVVKGSGMTAEGQMNGDIHEKEGEVLLNHRVNLNQKYKFCLS